MTCGAACTICPRSASRVILPRRRLLAELLWKGRFVKSDERRALALITMAAENAPAHDRIWIDEIYHSIYCATTHGTRQEATGLMARWRKMFARPVAEPVDRAGLGGRELQPERQCSNGEAVAIRRAGTIGGAAATSPRHSPRSCRAARAWASAAARRQRAT